MVRITKSQKEELEKAGLIKYRKMRNGTITQESNIYVANKEHMSRSKEYYVVEERKIMAFLGLLQDDKKPYHKNKRFNKNKNFAKAGVKND